VGGLYGVAIGRVFFGESMFARCSDASKVAFVWLVRQLQRRGFLLIDCQVHTRHLASLGARDIPRRQFCRILAEGCRLPPPQVWTFDNDLDVL
jgi:leucyl/phenylalanyl-tRNA--protein transferase